MSDYVLCNMCKSADTVIAKEGRLTFVRCNACGASRSVEGIKKGFQAVGRGDRRKARTQAGQ